MRGFEATVSWKAAGLLLWAGIVLSAAAGAGTYGYFVDTEESSGTVRAAANFGGLPSDAVAYDDSSPQNNQYDDGETTYTESDFSSLSGDPRLRLPSSVGSVKPSTMDVDAQSFVTESAVTFVTDSFDIRTSGDTVVQNGNIQANTIQVNGGGIKDLSRTKMEANSVTLTNHANGLILNETIIESDSSVAISGYGSSISAKGATIESGDSIEITSTGNNIDLRNANLEAANSITINAWGGTVDVRGATCDAPDVEINAGNERGSC